MLAKQPQELEASEAEARRAFLKNCAKYAAAMPPAITLLLAARNGKADPAASSPACSETRGNTTKPDNCPDDFGAPVDPELNTL